ncbi:XPG domain protein [Ceratobasidium sp. AG-Ba]|nr:XPG domain protein [Ceratobasidium sp. AG-Ba]
MGVHGLTTFLRENRRVLSRTQTFTNSFNAYTPLVVDGWSLIYTLYTDSGLQWVYGGEYELFVKCVQAIVSAWLAVGLEPYFVFDGPIPLTKIPTTLKRLTEVVQSTNIFFRTSAGARATLSFLSANRIIPPLLLDACIDALRELKSERVHIVMADGEADPSCVALAGALGGGLVVALDSDFAVLNAEGYGGYVPTDEMLWQSTGVEEATLMTDSQDLDGFQTITTKPRTKRKSSGLIPPATSSQDVSLTLTIYHPHILASHLQLPPALLPLFSALVGNDFSNPTHVRKFFENRSNVVERIWKVARAVSSAVKQKQEKASGDAVLDVIRAAVMKLLVRPDLMASGEIDKIVDETVDAALECTITAIDGTCLPISLSSGACPIHLQDECPLSTISSNFLRAYRAGNLSPRLMNAVTTGIVLPKPFLEDPDQKSCSNVASGIWSWIWAILAAGGHVQVPPNPSEAKSPLGGLKSPLGGIKSPQDTDSRLDDSELISVVEEFTATEPSVCSENLASELAERLRGLAGSLDDFDSGTDKPDEPEKTLVQYTRRGLKLVPEPVAIDLGRLEGLGSGLPEDWTKADRVKVFLQGTKSFTPALKSAVEGSTHPIGVLLWVCALRTVIQASAESVVTNVRTIQRVAQLLHAFDAGARLAELVYLFGLEGNGRNIVGQAVRMFSGRTVHSNRSSEVNQDLWALVCDGIQEDVWAFDQSPKKTKNKAKEKDNGKGSGKPVIKGVGFGVLAMLDDE